MNGVALRCQESVALESRSRNIPVPKSQAKSKAKGKAQPKARPAAPEEMAAPKRRGQRKQ